MESIPVFIGYDSREAVAYHVCCQSIIENCSRPVSFHPVTGEQRDGSNAFIYARFLIPWRMGYRGHALFIDGDMIIRDDIAKLWDLRRVSNTGVQVVKHDYKTKHPVKYLGNKNDDYPRKNWSSVMLWNCGYMPNRMLTPDMVEKASGEFLHRFQWLRDEEIGEIPAQWNRLVLEQTVSPSDKLLHYTIGTPCFSEYADCDSAEEWHNTLARALAPIKR